MVSQGSIDFDHVGIGKALSNNRFVVPPNQREYSWEEEHVTDIFQDFARSIGKGAYFLGTIVLTRSPTGALEVADGQQRLATTTILMAAIRDYFWEQKDTLNVESIESEFLTTIDREARSRVPRLKLNVDDNEFFRKRILLIPDQKERVDAMAKRESHRRIERAAVLAAEHIRNILRPHAPTHHTDELLRWIKYVAEGSQVIVLTVPDHLNAFRMFETLNDRGLKTSQADLLKNYLFGEASERLSEAQSRWSAMSWTLESLAVDDITMTYLRHLLVAMHGAIREREVYERVRSEIAGSYPSIAFLDELGDNAIRYAALLNPYHGHWNSYSTYGPRIRRHIETLQELRAIQIRPLLLACLRRFGESDIEKTFRMSISWVIRFMIAGGPTGVVEKHYAGRAQEVWRGEIKDATSLAKAMLRNLPADDAFRPAFSTLRVSKAYLARYLLRSLEQTIKRDPEPEHVVNDDQNILNLEHVMPEAIATGWPGVTAEMCESHHRRLGNMTLLRASANSMIGNASFQDKKTLYQASSSLEITKMILKAKDWGPTEIEKRQNDLAGLAVTTWSLAIR